MPEIKIDMLGGNCPVQAFGTVNGKPFYFRARGEHWSMSIGGVDCIGAPEWHYEEPFGTWPEAGWMSEEQAEQFLRAAAERYVKETAQS
jgi:hypothetical protein